MKVEISEKSSGAHHFKDKGHLPSAKKEGAHAQGKHEKPTKVEGSFANAGKPLVHVESDTMHNGRQHPPVSKLADSKLLKKAKSDDV